jgi:hypothetical protein
MANLGPISFSNPLLQIYQKSYIPSQTIYGLPYNVTKQEFETTTSHVLVKRQATGTDRTFWWLVFFAVFGVVFCPIGLFLGLYFTGRDSNSKARNVEK